MPAVIDAVEAGEGEHPGGWRRALVPMESLTHAEGERMRPGGQVEVVSPPELREPIAATTMALAALYG
ncbi:hypothetical protein [Streptomyces sp. NPDC059881]|uniref:hypothetical protein n=1 Tax=Streptomyces sp. NPDC059881 TaxID=3346986 RepID=UPI00365AA611